MGVVADEKSTGVVCHLAGVLDNGTVSEFRDAMAQVKLDQPVILALESVAFVDSAGLGALIGAIRRIRDMGGDAAVCSARPSVGRVLEIVGLARVVSIFDTVEEAEEYFSRWTAC